MNLRRESIRFLGFEDFLSALFVPPDARNPRALPLVVFIGHPAEAEAGRALSWLFEVGRQMREQAVLLRAGVIDDHCALCETDDVADPKTYARAVWRMKALHERLGGKVWPSRDRTIYTGFSFEGVYAWMLGYALPERCGRILALSSCCYPPQIQDHLDRAARVPATVVRAEHDHMFRREGLLAFERETGRRIEAAHPESRWILEPQLNHVDVRALWPSLLDAAVARCVDAGPLAPPSTTPLQEGPPR